MKYAFYNSGTIHFFNPNKLVYDPRDEVNASSLEFHKKLVKERNRKDCFIVDNYGMPLEPIAKSKTKSK
jgi:hypothetical protein